MAVDVNMPVLIVDDYKTMPITARPEADKVKEEKIDSEKDLLNGPQLPDKATSQEDIDKLLASFD